MLVELILHVADHGFHLGLAETSANQLLLKALDEFFLLLEQLGLQRRRRRCLHLEGRLPGISLSIASGRKRQSGKH